MSIAGIGVGKGIGVCANSVPTNATSAINSAPAAKLLNDKFGARGHLREFFVAGQSEWLSLGGELAAEA